MKEKIKEVKIFDILEENEFLNCQWCDSLKNVMIIRRSFDNLNGSFGNFAYIRLCKSCLKDINKKAKKEFKLKNIKKLRTKLFY